MNLWISICLNSIRFDLIFSRLDLGLGNLFIPVPAVADLRLRSIRSSFDRFLLADSEFSDSTPFQFRNI